MCKILVFLVIAVAFVLPLAVGCGSKTDSSITRMEIIRYETIRTGHRYSEREQYASYEYSVKVDIYNPNSQLVGYAQVTARADAPYNNPSQVSGTIDVLNIEPHHSREVIIPLGRIHGSNLRNVLVFVSPTIMR